MLLVFPGKAQEASSDSLKNILAGVLKYTSTHQFKEDTKDGFEGEWPTVMKMSKRFPLLGNASEYADANCFTVVNIHNELAEIYLTDTTQYSFLKPVISKAYKALSGYRTDSGFNFWRQYPVRLATATEDTIVWMRQPFGYKPPNNFMKNAVNIVNDADDSAMGLYADLLQQKIDSSFHSCSFMKLVAPYIDENRKNLNWYNYHNKDGRNTGAFMTWLGNEVTDRDPSMLNTALHNLFFYLPISKSYPKKYKPYMIYGTNDVDAVVNANVLFTLAKAGETDSSRIMNNAAAFIIKKFKQNEFILATIYYPNRYHLHAATARAYAAGIGQLNEAVDLLVTDIQKTQQPDGSFRSIQKLNDYDVVQSTVNALYALLHVDNLKQHHTKRNITNAMNYLLSQMQADEYGNYFWKGGVFFSGGTLVKNLVQFKSDTYTTVMMGKCLQMMIALRQRGEL